MISPTIQRQLLEELDRLDDAQQRQVLSYARSLTPAAPSGPPGRTLAQFAGSIPESDLTTMAAAIAAECERVDADEW